MGIYSFLEDKWYDVLEFVNKFVPVLAITDRVDKVIPSFVLFLLFILLLILGTGAFFFLSATSTYDVEVLVLSKAGNPIEGAKVTISMGCNEEGAFQLLTNSEGKVAFIACDSVVDVSVTKQLYKEESATFDFSEEKQKTISLSALDVPSREVSVSVVNSNLDLVSSATLELICIKGNDTNRQIVRTSNSSNTQGTSGFRVTVPNGCSLVQLKANASGFIENVVTLTNSETTKRITITKPVVEGTVRFTANSPIGLQTGAIITITDLDNADYTLYTLNGLATKTLAEGEYTYTAVASGSVVNGTFLITVNTTTDVNIYFSTLLPTVDRTKNIYISLKDGNSFVGGAEARIFVSKGNDTNYLMPLSSNTAGIIGPYLMLDTNQKTYTAIIKANNYETKLVTIELKSTTDTPQNVVMRQGGTTLKVKVIDDANVLLENVQTTLYISSFKAYFDKAEVTDKNGIAQYKGLPSGTYRITASTATAEGELTGVSVSGTTKEVTLRMITGTGKFKFNLKDEEGQRVNARVQFYVGNKSGTFDKKYEGRTTNFYYDSNTYSVEQKVKLIVVDENYFPTESFVYSIKRGSQEKTVYLRNTASLPNLNETQMILNQVYSSNPIYGGEVIPQKILAGQKYYLLFDLILNKEEDLNTIANFYVGPADQNELIAHNPVVINDAISKNESYSLLAYKKIGFEVEDSNANGLQVENTAKQLNVKFGSQQGLQSIPILVEIEVDSNASGKTKLFWQSRFGEIGATNAMSLLYSKEFDIGQTFCLGKACPDFLFSNYLQHNNSAYVPIDDKTQILLFGDTYKIKTIVENLTDSQIGDTNLTLVIEKTGQDRLSFTQDRNVIKETVAINALALSEPKEITLVTKKSGVGAIKVFESLQQMDGSTDLLAGATAANKPNYMNFEVRNRNDLNMIIVAVSSTEPNIIYEKSYYPFFTIKVRSRDGMSTSPTARADAIATWNATKNGQDFRCMPSSPTCTGITDINGWSVIPFDATNIIAGDKIVFTAIDINNSTPARLEVTVTKAFPDPAPDPVECIKIKIGTQIIDANYILNNRFPTIPLNIGETNNSLKIYYPEDASCEGNRRIRINTELLARPSKSFDINEGQEITVTLDGTTTVETNEGLLGAYPLEVFSEGAGVSSKVGSIDVIMSDREGSFTLSNAIIDLRTVEKVSTMIRNNRFSGRKDNFNPQVDISTNSVSLNYKKPGVPAQITLNPIVVGSAMESLINGYTWAQELGQTAKECAKEATTAVPDEFLYAEDSAKACEGVISSQEKAEATPRPEPDINLSSVSSGKINNNGKIFFEDTASDPTGGSSGRVAIDDEFVAYPTGAFTTVTTAPTSCKEMAHLNPFVSPEAPPEFGGDVLWTGTGQSWKMQAKMQILEVKECDKAYIVGAGDVPSATGGTGYSYIFHTQASQDCGRILGMGCIKRWDTCTFNTQVEWYSIVNWQQEVRKTWTKNYTIVPMEGKVVPLGSYEANPSPIWGDIDTVKGNKAGDEWEENGMKLGALCVQPMGFVPQDGAYSSQSSSVDFPKDNYLEDPANPLVEYDNSGLVKYKLLPSSIPEGVRMFLHNGKVYAEYVGVAEVDGKDIDINISKVNLQGIEYAIITVKDWVGETKETKTFRVKLIGNPTNCYTAEGVAGLTGPQFAPRLMFNWDWNAISQNTCDSSNGNYVYCDATQFTTELFKKLPILQSAIVNIQNEQLPRLTRFYSYLIKDNYSDIFLRDYKDYFATAIFNSNNFNSSSTSTGYDKFITENRLHFRMRDISGNIIETTSLPKGGIYSVEIDINYDNPNMQSLFDGNNLNANITVTLMLIREAPNYNPFYETPFDGLVGIKDGVNSRVGYGAGIDTISTEQSLLLTPENLVLGKNNNALVKVGYTTTRDLLTLNRGIVLDYINNPTSKLIKLNPSQPTPVLMNITASQVGPVTANYSLQGDDAETTMKQKWTMVSSTIGKPNCTDFAGDRQYTFTDQIVSPGKRKLVWPNGRYAGTVSLGTVFFTPKESIVPVLLSTDNNSIRVYSVDSLVGEAGRSVFLKYYDNKTPKITDYDSIKGVLDRIATSQMCVTQNQAERMQVFWNPDYLNALVNGISEQQGSSCSE